MHRRPIFSYVRRVAMTDSKTEALTTALAQTIDPILVRPLSELGYVTSARVKRLGSASIGVLLPVPGPPGHAVIEAVTTAAQQVDGVRSVQIQHELMTDEQRAELMEQVRGEKKPVGSAGSSTYVIAVSSGKGGVGKSSVTTNLAVSLASLGHTVGVIDADVWGYSIPKMLGAEGAPAVIADSIIPLRAYGVSVISIDYFVPDGQAVVWRGPMLHKALEQFLTDVFWDDPEFLLIDMPPGTGDIAISISQFVPRARVLLVTTPQPTASRVASRAARMADRVDQKVIGVVENMSWFVGDDGKHYEIFGSGGGADLAEDTGTDLLAQIPILPAMRSGADRGEPVTVAAPGSEAAHAFDDLARKLIQTRPKIRTHPELRIG
ncbi:MAG: Mrp/NBP35 family ATP-binding protein [bacterium]|nr:Mrp/NBP35 family ATP-binding protein [bacterium]